MQHNYTRRIAPYDFNITVDIEDADVKKVYGGPDASDPDDLYFTLFGPKLPDKLPDEMVPAVLRMVATLIERGQLPVTAVRVNAKPDGEVDKPPGSRG